MRQLWRGALRLLLVAFLGVVALASFAQTKVSPDCSSGHYYVDGYLGDGANAYASVDALCAALAVSYSSPSYMVLPGQCVLRMGSAWWSEVVWDLCSPTGLSGVSGVGSSSSGGISQSGTAESPVYVSLLGPLSPASASSMGSYELTGADSAKAFAFGLGSVLTLFLLGWGVGLGVSLVRKA